VFDISFSELVVIAIVALLVIGPEKLPKVARTAGAFFGRLQRFVSQVKDEVNRESRFAELQKLQGEVESSLQKNYADIEQSILQPEPFIAEAIETPPVKKTRKPRQAKVKEIASDQITAAAPRRGRVASAKSELADVQKNVENPVENVAVGASVTGPRQRKSKSTKLPPNTDLFAAEDAVDKPHS
jgi:sec-independent protein translocase protein TatB